MLNWIFEKRTAFVLLSVLLVAVGVVVVALLPIQLYPQTQRPRVRVRIDHEGYSAVDFYREFGDEVESNLMAVEGVDILEVSYGNDDSDFTMTFDWSVDSDTAKADTESAMNTIDASLPQDIQGSYNVHFFAGENAGYLMMGVTASTASPEEMYTILKAAVEPRLNRIEDVDLVEIFNVEDLKAEVTLRQADMLAYGLTISQVDAAMRLGYLPEPLGRLEEGDKNFSVRFSRGVQSLYDVGNLVIDDSSGVIVTLKDIADIDIRYDLPRQTFIMDGAPGVRITVTPVDGGNIRKMSQNVQRVLAETREAGTLPADTKLLLFLDPAEYINRSIRSIVQSAAIGAALAMMIVLLALGQLRNTLLIGIALPVTLVLSFILMYAFNVSLNLISLGGIALAVGMVLDSSIVVMENIHRLRMEEAPIRDDRHLRDLIIRAIAQVRSPVIASILTSILVFLPISFTAPLTNAILGDQAKAVIFSLLFSMFVALALVPLLAFAVYRVRASSRRPVHRADEVRGLQKFSVPLMNFVVRVYKALLRGIISRQWASVSVILISFGILVILIVRVLPLIPKEIISPPSSDRIVVFMRSPVRTDPRVFIDEILPAMQDRLMQRVGPYVESTYAEVRGQFNRFFINIKDTRDADYVLGELQDLFVSDNVWYYNHMMWDPAQLPLPRTMDLQIGVNGEDEQQLIAILEQIRDKVNESELYGWAFTEPSTSLADQLVMTARKGTIEGFPGITESSLVGLVRRILRGTGTLEFNEGADVVEVAAVYPEDLIAGRQALANFLIPYRQSAVPLKHFFDFSDATGVAGLTSENGERIFRLYGKMKPGTPAAQRLEKEEAVREILEAELELPRGYSVVFEDSQVELNNAIRSLYLSLAVAVVLIYLLLAFQFNSLRIPLVILVTVPLGFIGVVISLYVFKSTLSLNSMLGTILLAGVVVNNAIIMIDFYLKRLPSATNKIDALVETAGIRFSPIMITTLTTIVGMLPIAIGMGEGSNIVQPLGIAVSGGLLISTLFTLFVVPSILSLMNVKVSAQEPTVDA